MSFGALTALDGISLEAKAGELVAIVGPSGCGKSTLLQLIAGLLEPSAGEVKIGNLLPRQTRAQGLIGFLFQDDALLPWRTALANVHLPVELLRKRHRANARDARQLMQVLGLGGFEAYFPRQLSGGMRQRVAIARSLVTRPKLLLLDEPFGALDEPLRRRLMIELENIWLTEGPTILFVTHTLSEAVFLADRVVILSARPGRIVREIVVPDSRPRGQEFLRSQGFQDTLEAVVDAFPVAD